MVKVRDDLPETKEGGVDLTRWIERLCHGRGEELNQKKLLHAAEWAREKGSSLKTLYHDSCFHHGIAIAEVLKILEPDLTTYLSALLYPTVKAGAISLDELRQSYGEDVVKIIKGLEKVEATHHKKGHNSDKRELSFTADSADNLRHMLLAVIEDLRVVLIKLAERIIVLRACDKLEEKVRVQIAQEANDIYAPLANRLGIGQIKWELEDLAFRYLEPIAYKQIAKSLAEKRVDREGFMKAVTQKIAEQLIEEGVTAEVYGRVKHIYSIWRKMKRKQIPFSEVYDVRAVRIIVQQVRDCYAALGVVHGLWQHIPNEFDDYIATPKKNGYRSLHTAVIGPNGKHVEIQIRTASMHKEAELGVAAHWIYKEGKQNQDETYLSKVNAIRSLLDESDEFAQNQESRYLLNSELSEDRVYVFTPKGDAVDLPAGATPIDYAFNIHTALGYRCRGAKVNGAMVPLTYSLKSGDQVEVLTTKEGGPSRDWLNPNLGYLRSSKSIAKVHSWFRKQERDQNMIQGKEILDRELRRLHLDQVPFAKLAAKLHYKDPDDMYAALGGGDLRIGQILNHIQLYQPEERPDEIPTRPSKITKQRHSQVKIHGIGNMLCSYAKCCRPVPYDSIIGYVTLGRGVSIHRKDCINVLEATHESRLIEVEWGNDDNAVFSVEIEIFAYDRQGLLRDITSILSNEKVNVVGSSSRTNPEDAIAKISLTLQVTNLEILGRVLNKMMQLPNIIEAKRTITERK